MGGVGWGGVGWLASAFHLPIFERACSSAASACPLPLPIFERACSSAARFCALMTSTFLPSASALSVRLVCRSMSRCSSSSSSSSRQGGGWRAACLPPHCPTATHLRRAREHLVLADELRVLLLERVQALRLGLVEGRHLRRGGRGGGGHQQWKT